MLLSLHWHRPVCCAPAPLPDLDLVPGDIPSELGKLSRLVVLELHDNQLSGESGDTVVPTRRGVFVVELRIDVILRQENRDLARS